MPDNPYTTEERISREALKYFTNRDGFIDSFLKYLDAPEQEKLKVLVFCGVGGIGRTTLIRKIGMWLDEGKSPYPNPPLPHARFDIETLSSPVQAYREALLRLRTDLGNHFHVSFPRFDLCLAVMLAKEGGTPPPLVQVNPHLNTAYKFCLNLSPIPFTSAAASAVRGSLIKETAHLNPWFEAWIRRAGKTEEILTLREMALHDDQKLPDELMERFGLDLRDNLPERPGKAIRGVLFLDSFERLWAGRETDRSAQARLLDAWVRQLAVYCLHSGVLLVIAGRDHLRWDEDDPNEWHGWLEQHLMGGLSAPDAQVFLSKCQIGLDSSHPASPLQQAIINCCNENLRTVKEAKCHSLFLALCAEIVLNTRRQTHADPPLETFHAIPPGKEANELADRFLKSLHNRALEKWLEELSLTPRFDQTAALSLRGDTSRHEAEVAWETLISFSFATSQPDGFWRLHETMRDALRLRTSDDAARRVHTHFRDYWQAHGDVALTFFHSWSLDPLGSLAGWTQAHQIALRERRITDARRLLVWWADISLDEADRHIIGDELWATSHGMLANTLYETPIAPRTATLTEAITHNEAALRVYTETDFPQQWAMTQYNLGLTNLQFAQETEDVSALVTMPAHFTAAERGFVSVGMTDAAEQARSLRVQIETVLQSLESEESEQG